MKWVFAIVLIAVAGALGVLAVDPHMDIGCVVAKARDVTKEERKDWQCIHHAAARDDVGAVRASLDNGLSPNVRTPDGQTPLNVAAEYGSLDVVRALIGRDAELEARDGRNGFTALHWAAKRYHPAVARALIAAGAKVNAENKWKQTPLWVAAWQPDQGNTEMAHILVAAGADIGRTDHKDNTPLIMAARSGHRPMIGYLLDLGATIEARNDQGRRALFQAVAGGHPDAVRLLLARGADPNAGAGGVAPLALALEDGRREIAELLTANGATGYRQYAADAALKRGRNAYADGDYDAAIDEFSAAIALQSDSADAYYRRGLAFAGKGAQHEAEIDLRQSLSLNDDNGEARETLARLYVDEGNYESAVTALEHLLAKEPDNARALYLLAESRSGLGEPSQASGHFHRACTLGFQPACSR
ncbi:ankyrin [Salinisphaera dokdonensis CL-ES53]|uniref:Ankyrin n=1 Tax=Salinisphaera dokdonensis CL-ES53 TaxID=1304272 RepID=A0ABV2B4V1_9GAMM